MFTHIPKTGGTSFKHSVVYKNLPKDRIFRYSGLRSFIRSDLRNFDFVDGHFPDGIHYFTLKKCVYATILREPLDHAISYYYFILQCDYDDYKHPRLAEAQNSTLLEFTRRNPNPQTTALAGFPWNRVVSRRSKRLLNIALSNLRKRYKCVGTLDALEEFEKSVSAHFDWDYAPVYEQTKITRERPRVDELSDADKDHLRVSLSLDRELYDEVKKWNPKTIPDASLVV